MCVLGACNAQMCSCFEFASWAEWGSDSLSRDAMSLKFHPTNEGMNLLRSVSIKRRASGAFVPDRPQECNRVCRQHAP